MNKKSKKLDPRVEDEILRKAERVDAVLVRVEALRFTLPLLKKAGFSNVTPFHRYLVPVEYSDGGFLRVKVSRRTA
jgi:hypothetical protein